MALIGRPDVRPLVPPAPVATRLAGVVAEIAERTAAHGRETPLDLPVIGSGPRGTHRLARAGTLMGVLLGAMIATAGCGQAGSVSSPAVPGTGRAASAPSASAAMSVPTSHAAVPPTSDAAAPPSSHMTSPTTPRPPSTSAPGEEARPAVPEAPLPSPAALRPFVSPPQPGEGSWHGAGRAVDGLPAVYVTALRAPGSRQSAGIAWLDSHLLAARLYSGSESPGGGPWRYTAPIEPAEAATLVAAFNGGFKMAVAGGGYYTQRRLVVPLRAGAASLVVYADGSTGVGAWGTDVHMTPAVVDVRQNLLLLVDGGRPTAATADWRAWGATIGGVEGIWRSGVGTTADGALVYVTGPELDPLQLAQLLVRAGAIRAMQLDINPDWTVMATYEPPDAGGLASPADGAKLVPGTVQGPWTFFEPTWARDFVTLSVRPGSRP